MLSGQESVLFTREVAGWHPEDLEQSLPRCHGAVGRNPETTERVITSGAPEGRLVMPPEGRLVMIRIPQFG